MYLKCAQLCRRVELFLREKRPTRNSSGKRPRYMSHRYLLYATMVGSIVATSNTELVDLDSSLLPDVDIESWLKEVAEMDVALRAERKLRPEAIEKLLTERLLEKHVVGDVEEGDHPLDS